MAGHLFSLEPVSVPPVETAHRRIATAVPCPGTADVLARLDATESRSMHGQLPLVWDRAVDYNVFDASGNKWIDFTSCIFVTNVGHSNQHVSDAIRQTLDQPLYSCYAYGNEVRAKYLEKLIAFAGKPFEKAFLMSAGTEATEAALKLMRMHAQKIGKRRRGIIAIQNNWHGRTLAAQMMSSNEAQKAWIGYQDADIHFIPFPYSWDLDDKSGISLLRKGLDRLKADGIDLSQDIAGFMLETFQGWGAVFYPAPYVQTIREICNEHDILLTFDEMQSGFARTGKAFGYQHYGVEPDLICTGKGMGGGVPISGVIGRAEIMDLPEIGNMSSTHSANPLSCAAALAVIEEIESKNLIAETARKGELLFSELRKLEKRFPDRLGESLGQGLIASVLIYKPGTREPDGLFASRVCELAMQRGLLMVHTGRESIKLGPPLTIPDEAIFEALAVLGSCIARRGSGLMILAVRHTGIVVADLDAALRFWCDLLGFTVSRRMEESGAHIDAVMELADVKVTTVKLAARDGSLIELLKFHSHPDMPAWTGSPVTTGLTHVALTVDDLDVLYETLSTAGLRFHTPPQFSPDGYAKFTYCRGPEGLILELVEVLAK